MTFRKDFVLLHGLQGYRSPSSSVRRWLTGATSCWAIV